MLSSTLMSYVASWQTSELHKSRMLGKVCSPPFGASMPLWVSYLHRCTPFFAACGSLSAHTSGGTGTFTPALSVMPAALAALSVQGWLPCLSKGHAVVRLPASCLRAHMSIMTRGERPAR